MDWVVSQRWDGHLVDYGKDWHCCRNSWNCYYLTDRWQLISCSYLTHPRIWSPGAPKTPLDRNWHPLLPAPLSASPNSYSSVISYGTPTIYAEPPGSIFAHGLFGCVSLCATLSNLSHSHCCTPHKIWYFPPLVPHTASSPEIRPPAELPPPADDEPRWLAVR